MIDSIENYSRFPFNASAALTTHAGASLITESMDLLGLCAGLQTLNRYNPGTATHQSGKILTDMADMIAVGWDCPQDIDMLRTTTRQHPLFGQVASAPTEARFVEALTSTAPVSAVTDFTETVKAARTRAWELAAKRSPCTRSVGATR